MLQPEARLLPQMRGRVMGLFVTAFLGIMPISGLVFGSVGQFIGPSNAVLIGATGLIAWSLWLVMSGALTPERRRDS